MNIKFQMSEDIAKKIFGNLARAQEYLALIGARGKTSGSADTWSAVVDSWNYDRSLPIIREMFKETTKYARGQSADKVLAQLQQEWNDLGLGSVAWPFSQGDFDGFVQRINASNTATGQQKDQEAQSAALKYRRIKEINTYRNDFIETLIFEKNQNILPTLNHRRGVDFYIDGVSFDQKVAKSPTAQFKKTYGEQWRQTAIAQPELVASYLYQYQDEGRFGADPRLLVVYLDEDISTAKIREIVNAANLDNPRQVTFTFKHKLQGPVEYKVACYVILLHA
jgi:hypothetical protein